MLKFVYSFFLGLLLAVFVGMGVASFYPAPQPPEYPVILQEPAGVGKEYTETQRKADAAYQKDYKVHSDRSQEYNRNVSMIVLAAAVLLLVIGLLLHGRLDVLADGLLLGGTFTLLYSIGRSFAGEDPKYSFAVVSVGLIVTMVVGYLKFVRPEPKKSKKR